MVAHAFEPGDLFGLSWAVAPQAAPSGTHVMFLRRVFDIHTDRHGTELWVTDLREPGELKARLLVGADVAPSFPCWCPHSEQIAFVTSTPVGKKIGIVELRSGALQWHGPYQLLLPGQLTWCPRGNLIALTAHENLPDRLIAGMPLAPPGAQWAPPARVITEFRYRQDGVGFLPRAPRAVFVVDVHSSDCTQLTRQNNGEVVAEGRLSWLPDAQAVVAAMVPVPQSDWERRSSELYVVPVNGSAACPVTTGGDYKYDPAVSPDGGHVAYTQIPNTRNFYAQPEIRIQGLPDGASRVLVPTLDRPSQAAAWIDGGRAIAFVYYDRGRGQAARVHVNGGRLDVVAGDMGGVNLRFPYARSSASDTGAVVAYPGLHADRPPDLVVRDDDHCRSINFNASWTSARAGLLEEIVFAAPSDGRMIQGWVRFPPCFDEAKSYPLILEIHGGPNNFYGPQFSVGHQLLSAGGYIVLFINPRGSISYGSEFANLIDGKFPGEDYDDLMGAVDHLLPRPYIDRDNLMIAGGSAGGTLTAWAISKTRRFRAAAIYCPAIDWTAESLTCDYPADFVRYQFSAYPWEDLAQYWHRSPLSRVGEVATPTLLVVGECDWRTPIVNAEMYYQALRLRGVPAKFVRLPEADHEMGRPSQWLASIMAVREWFDSHRSHFSGSHGPGG